MKILAIIPARGGSKGIPRKNIKLFRGKPLIYWSILAARQSRLIDRVVVSTEDQEIADVARECGGEVPFLRPERLAEDDTPTISVVDHAIEVLSGYDSVLILQPTSPLRTAEDIDGIITLCNDSAGVSAASICEVSQSPFLMYERGPDLSLCRFVEQPPSYKRRQDYPSIFMLNGALYLVTIDYLKQHRTLVGDGTLGFLMPKERSVDLDDPDEWAEAESMRSHVDEK